MVPLRRLASYVAFGSYRSLVRDFFAAVVVTFLAQKRTSLVVRKQHPYVVFFPPTRPVWVGCSVSLQYAKSTSFEVLFYWCRLGDSLLTSPSARIGHLFAIFSPRSLSLSLLKSELRSSSENNIHMLFSFLRPDPCGSVVRSLFSTQKAPLSRCFFIGAA